MCYQDDGKRMSQKFLFSGVVVGGVSLCLGIGACSGTFCEAGNGGCVMNCPFGQEGEKASFRSVATT